MTEMASGASVLDFDATQWDVSKVRDMGRMFQDAVSFVGGDGISTWSVDSVTNVDEMFHKMAELVLVHLEEDAERKGKEAKKRGKRLPLGRESGGGKKNGCC